MTYTVQLTSDRIELPASSDDITTFQGVCSKHGEWFMSLRTAKATARALAQHGLCAVVLDENNTIVYSV